MHSRFPIDTPHSTHKIFHFQNFKISKLLSPHFWFYFTQEKKTLLLLNFQ